MAKRIRGARRKTVWAVLFVAAVLLLCAAACAEETQCVDSSGNIYSEHHWIESVVTPPTCQADGNTLYYCTQCGNYYTGNVIPAGEQHHNWEWYEDGSETHHRECSYCGDKKDPEPHNWSAWYTSAEAFAAKYGFSLFSQEQLKDPTCTENGVRGRFCEDCWYTQTETAKSPGHAYKWTVVKAATCEAEGLQSGKCSACGADAEDEVIPALGHDPVSHDAKAPTCSAT